MRNSRHRERIFTIKPFKRSWLAIKFNASAFHKWPGRFWQTIIVFRHQPHSRSHSGTHIFLENDFLIKPLAENESEFHLHNKVGQRSSMQLKTPSQAVSHCWRAVWEELLRQEFVERKTILRLLEPQQRWHPFTYAKPYFIIEMTYDSVDCASDRMPRVFGMFGMAMVCLFVSSFGENTTHANE